MFMIYLDVLQDKSSESCSAFADLNRYTIHYLFGAYNFSAYNFSAYNFSAYNFSAYNFSAYNFSAYN